MGLSSFWRDVGLGCRGLVTGMSMCLGLLSILSSWYSRNTAKTHANKPN